MIDEFPRIGPPLSNQERRAVLALLRLDEITAFGSGEIVAAWEGSTPLVAAGFTIASDGSAFVWPPDLDDARATSSLADAVLCQIVSQIDARGCPIALAVVPTPNLGQRQVLTRAGFLRAAEIGVLEHRLGGGLPISPVPEIRLRRLTDGTAAHFATVIEQVQAQSADCCAVSLRRSGREILDSFRIDADFTPEQWRLASIDDQDVGVVLVNDRLHRRGREIAYLGVVPSARRRGVGRSLIATVLRDARAAGCETVVTTVDRKNAAAADLYRRSGFITVERQIGYVRSDRNSESLAGIRHNRSGSTSLH